MVTAAAVTLVLAGICGAGVLAMHSGRPPSAKVDGVAAAVALVSCLALLALAMWPYGP